MRKLIFLVLILLPCTLMAKQKMVKLFNEKNLSNWESYLPPNSAKTATSVFSILRQNGINYLHITGEVNGSLSTRKEYANYHLRMVFKWGSKVYKQFNSGILYHSYGPFGEGLGVWMSAHEFQLCTGKMGDSYCMGNSYFEIASQKDPEGKSFRYAPGEEVSKFGVNFPAKNCSKLADHEKPSGEWNVVDLYCFGRNSVHLVNGSVVMVNYNSGRIEKDGTVLPLSGGKIQIQSEGGELFIKSITIEKIKGIPAEFLK